MTDTLHQEARAWRLALFTCRVVVGGVFVTAAVSKIADPNEFARAVYQFHLLPDWAINAVAVFLPWVELSASVALLVIRRLRDAAAAITGFLALVFAAAITLNILRGIEAPCGCFATLGRTPAGWGHVVGNAALASVSLLLIANFRKEQNVHLTRL